MSATVISGKDLSAQIRLELKKEVDALRSNGIRPGLAVVLVGDDPASHTYVNMKKKACDAIGIESFRHLLPNNASEAQLLKLIGQLNQDPRVHGILVQLPLPSHMNKNNVLCAVDPMKDVDCFHPINVGRLFTDNPVFAPCTPAGIMKMIKQVKEDITGLTAVVIGRSNIVGKPLAMMLLQKNATVTMCHSRTKDLAKVAAQADILVAAIGRAHFVTKDMVKQGAIVIDVGITRGSDGKLKGDVDFDRVVSVAGAITPVPNGVGPMTITSLLENTIVASKMQNS